MTPYSRSVIDLIRAQMVGAAGRITQRYFTYAAIAANPYGSDGYVESLIFAPHGGEELDNLCTASTYKAKA